MENGFKHIGEKIRAVRKSRGMTQEELAYFIGVSVPTLVSYEKGRVIPDAEIVAKLAAFFQISSDTLINENVMLMLENGDISFFRDGIKISDEDREKLRNSLWK